MQASRQWKVWCVAGLCALAGAWPAFAQDNGLRERLRERAQARAESRAESRADAPAQRPAAAGSLARPGTHRITVRHDGRLREALVHVPPAITGGRALPMVLAFHGGGGDMDYQAGDAYGLSDKADRAGFIAVFPNGTGALRREGGLATWNAGHCCGRARDDGVDDVGFVRALVAELQRRLPVDRQRIHATGMSNGGMMAHRLACEAADLFASVAAVAGTDNTTACAPSRPIPVLHLHALDDTHVLYGGGAGPDAFRDPAKVTEFTSVSETMARWAQRNACSAPPRRVLTVPGAWCERHAGCSGGVAVQLCVTETGGHSWPGATVHRRGKPPPSQALSANDVIWDFFGGR